VVALDKTLKALVGLPLSVVRRAADMRVFHFGATRPHPAGKGTVGVYALHVQCPWRLVASDRVLTGSSDGFVPPLEGTKVDPSDPRRGSLQDVRLVELLQGYDEITKSHINATAGLVVEAVSTDQFASVDIAFIGGLHLQLFPDGSVEENWRFFAPGEDDPHLVIEGGAIALE
jgi:hypothetical protein